MTHKMNRCAWLLLLVSVAGVQRAEAQGLGPLIDWIGKLSGPQFVQAGAFVSFRLEEGKNHRVRLAAMYGTSFDEDVPGGIDIRIFTFQPTVEAAIAGSDFEFVFGAAYHSFSGDIPSFSHLSFPLELQWRPQISRSLFFRIAAGARVFPAFGEDDFPNPIHVSTDQADIVPAASIGLEIDLFRFTLY
jgi:hypothetical protein